MTLTRILAALDADAEPVVRVGGVPRHRDRPDRELLQAQGLRHRWRLLRVR